MDTKYDNAFGKNDIRGIYNEDITEELFYNVGRGFINFLKDESKLSPDCMYLTVCMDARLHSPSLSKSLQLGIISAGAHVVNLGLAPTPIGYYSEAVGIPESLTTGNKVIAACIVTASHNPKEYNGLKLTYNKRTLTESQIKKLKEYTEKCWSSNIKNHNSENIIEYDIIPKYIEEMKSKFGLIGRNIRVVVDSANATGGIVGPKLYRELGCEVIELFSEPDGNFPNHHPNPSVESTLDDLKKSVISNSADIGIAFDGDSDRIGVVDDKGNYLTGDKLLFAYSTEVIDSYKKKNIVPDIVSEVKCSQVLYDAIDNLGGKSHMCKTGHGYIKSMMQETGAVLAGEMSGHMFFKDRYYGYDDAIYAGCRIIEILSKHKQLNKDFSIRDLIKPFDKVFTSAEVRYSCPNNLKASTMNSIKEKISNNMNIFNSNIREIITIDGLRIVFSDGFALIRQSNTEPVFTLRFEAQNKEKCESYKNIMISLLDDILKAAV